MSALLACSPRPYDPTQSHSLGGIWASDNSRYLWLAEDGSLGFPGQLHPLGLAWSHQGEKLRLTTLAATSDIQPQAEIWTITGLSNSKLQTRLASGQDVSWKRDEKQVRLFTCSFTGQGDVFLPETVLISVRLYTGENQVPFAHGLTIASPPFLSIRVPYLANQEGNGPIFMEAEILIAGVPILATARKMEVRLLESPHIQLQRVDAARRSAPVQAPVSLEQTYWRLKALNGNSAQHFPNQPEAHLILRGDQAVGSDGCNNFFMGWRQNGQTLRFTNGGSTLMLCPNGMEQADEMLSTLQQVDGWSIKDQELKLTTKSQLIMEFEAIIL